MALLSFVGWAPKLIFRTGVNAYCPSFGCSSTAFTLPSLLAQRALVAYSFGGRYLVVVPCEAHIDAPPPPPFGGLFRTFFN